MPRQSDIEQYFPLVRMVLSNLKLNIQPPLEYCDLFSAGVKGLQKAIQTYNPEFKCKFSTWATYRIRWFILDCVRHINKSRAKHQIVFKSIEATVWRPDNNKCKLLDVIPLMNSEGQSDISSEIDYYINELPQMERIVIILYYYEGMTLTKIGEWFELSESRMSQIKLAAIKKLRRSITDMDAPAWENCFNQVELNTRMV